ncbi:MAG: hypothetical protein JWO06_3009 [Bacteroidota bacterium]|nr:hypothetical protein [Bacteroidota bacterium]
MKRFLLIVFIIAIKLVSQAQPFGNEWIDYSQVHFKIKVPADGRYRITGSVLASAIPNLSSLNPASFVMYHNGQTVPILVSTTGSIGANDFIEFYAKHNIGDLDSTLYNDGSVQPHIYFSLFTDTSIYYLTIKSGASNPRFTSTPNNLSSLPPKENYFIFPSRQFFTGNYIAGQYYFIGQEELFKSTFDVGEGYGSANWFGSFSNGSQVVNQSFNIPTPSVFATGPAATYQTVYLNYSPVDNHQVQIQLNLTPLISSPPVISGFKFNRLTTQIPANQLGTTNNIIFSEQQSGSSSQQNVVMYNEIDYPHSFDLGGQNTFYFTLDADNGSGRYLEITNFTDNGLQPVLYDWSNGYARIITSTQSPGTYTVNSPLKFYLPSSSTPRELFLTSADPSTINFVSSLQPVAFQNYSAANFSMQGDYLIISDSSLDVNGDVTAYRNYRDYTSSPSTGKYNARIYNIEQLYDQFAYGVRKSPNAIRNFIQYALATWSSSTGPNGTGYKPKYVFLIGKGREYPSMRFSDAATKQCLVPTFGYPGSDNLLAATRHSDLPTVSIGRLAAQRPQQVSDYLAKMKDYEIQQSIPLYGSPLPQDIPPKIWQKQVLHFSGGSSNIEQFQFHSYLAADSTRVVDTLWGAHVTTYSKTTNEPISQELSQVIKGQINQGVSLISFFGHSATGAFDFSIDEPENYTNYQKYPVIVSNGCFSGFIHDVDTGYSERFVLEANKGAIAFMATSSLSLADGLNTFTSNLYNNLSGPKYFSTFGSCVRQTLNNVYSCCSGNTNAILAAYEMTLHGDPD